MTALEMAGPPPLPTDISEQAACVGADPALFDDENPPPAVLADAAAICRRCPVKADCLAHARAYRITTGVWGGLAHGGRRPILSHDELVARHRQQIEDEQRRQAQVINPATGKRIQPCGTRTRYMRGCRCDACAEAARTYYREAARIRAARRRNQQRKSA